MFFLEQKDLWQNFMNSGKIDDYLKYKNQDYFEKEANKFEPYNNQRFDNQGTKGWRS